MGYYLALKLKSAGHSIDQVFSRNKAGGAGLAERVHAALIDDLQALRPDATCYILAVPDSALADTAAALPPFVKNKVLIHCAGAVPVDLFLPFSPHAGVLWPLYSIRKHRLPATDIPLFIEGTTAEALEQVRELANSLSASVTVADTGKRRQLHLAAVFSNNFVNHLLAVTQQLLEHWQMPPDWLEPLVTETLESWKAQSAVADQTGPARRNDGGTMNGHMELLREHPAWQQLYRSISESIRDLYKSNPK